MSSLTRSSAASASRAVRSRPACSRSRATAVSTGANATSWKSKLTAAATGQLSAYDAETRYAAAVAWGPPPNARRVNIHTGGIASANSTACAIRRLTGLLLTQYSGAKTARIGDQWSPSTEKSGPNPLCSPLMIEIPGRR